jgi:2-polyprenyl-6-methoxyphenol hydroxylase-like FAD-dependent oxidoreductase
VHAVIVGGGVGGLSTAVNLQQEGIEASVFERESDLARAQVGGAFTIYSNAMLPLTEMGVGDRVRASGSVIERVELRSWTGGKVYAARTLEPYVRRWGTPNVGISRTNLHRILAGALDSATLTRGMECVGFAQDGESATAEFANGTKQRSDILVGADGSRSLLRRLQLPHAERKYAGYTVWQGIAENFEHPNIPENTLIVWYGRGIRLCLYHVGGGRPYWAALYTTAEGGRDPQGRSKQVVLDLYRGWQEPIEALIDATPDGAISRMDNHGGTPLDRWGSGRMTLLGDAAHPTTIDIGQGACQAIEDAFTLRRALREHDDPAEALRAYERGRIARTNAVMKAAWRVGFVGQWRNPILARIRGVFLGAGWDSHVRTITSPASEAR